MKLAYAYFIISSVNSFTTLPALAQSLSSQAYTHIPNTYCQYYEYGGDGPCESGRAFDDVWQHCENDGDKCMGVMWNSCTGPTSDTSVNGAWKLMSAGQEVGDADNPTATCGGKDQALGHWDVFIKKDPPYIHVPNTYCNYYEYGGDGPCESGRAFDDVWQHCENDGDKCMGVMWNSCTGPTSDTSVNGAWKLMSAGQEVGDADNPTATCGGKDQALGHWDVFLRKEIPDSGDNGGGDNGGGDNGGGIIVVEPGLNHCEILRLELIVGCTSLLSLSFFGAIAYAGCMASAATAWHICFENMDRRLESGDSSNFSDSCGDDCLKMLRKDIDVPEMGSFDMHGLTDDEIRVAYHEGVIYGEHLVSKLTGN